MTSLAESTSPLTALTTLDELRADILNCKAAAPDREMRLALHDVHDALCRIQSELAGGEAAVPLSAVEALGQIRGRLALSGRGEFSDECGIAAGRARQALARVSAGERRISITSESYLRRLSQLLSALSRPGA
jgi:hypothetical protein